MIKLKNKRILIILMLVLTIFSALNPSVFATEISSANIQNKEMLNIIYNIGTEIIGLMLQLLILPTQKVGKNILLIV